MLAGSKKNNHQRVGACRLLISVFLSLLMVLFFCVSITHGACGDIINNEKTSFDRRVVISCGGHRVFIFCGKKNKDDPRFCDDNVLCFESFDGLALIPMQPRGFAQEFVVEKTPTGIACGSDDEGYNYVLVDYSAGPLSCGPCHILELFTEGGDRLTVNGENLDDIVRVKKMKFSTLKYIEEYE